ncbi:MAG TPA: hypothetical protein VIY73_05505 [Polyangiaceae bacterium]
MTSLSRWVEAVRALSARGTREVRRRLMLLPLSVPPRLFEVAGVGERPDALAGLPAPVAEAASLRAMAGPLWGRDDAVELAEARPEADDVMLSAGQADRVPELSEAISDLPPAKLHALCWTLVGSLVRRTW